MSSPPPESPLTTGVAATRGRKPRKARVLTGLRRLRDLLAVLGVVSVMLAVWLYNNGMREAGGLAPDARRYLARAGWETLGDNVAAALATRVAVAEGTTPEALERALRTRAVELGLPLDLIYPLPVAGRNDPEEELPASADGESPNDALRVWTACHPEQVAQLVALEPRLLAFMPCRIALYRDPAGRFWLATVNLELLVTGGREPAPALRREAVAVHDRILDLIAAAGG